jgi:hypothetical protein
MTSQIEIESDGCRSSEFFFAIFFSYLSSVGLLIARAAFGRIENIALYLLLVIRSKVLDSYF